MSCVISREKPQSIPSFAQRPTPAELHSRMKALLPAIKARAGDTERLGRIPADSLDALREAGLYRVVQPTRFEATNTTSTCWSNS